MTVQNSKKVTRSPKAVDTPEIRDFFKSLESNIKKATTNKQKEPDSLDEDFVEDIFKETTDILEKKAKSVKKTGNKIRKKELEKDQNRRNVQMSLSHVNEKVQKKIIKSQKESLELFAEEVKKAKEELKNISNVQLFKTSCAHLDRFSYVLPNGMFSVECIHCSRIRSLSQYDWEQYIFNLRKKKIQT